MAVPYQLGTPVGAVRSWLDAFPWIESAAEPVGSTGRAEAWWLQQVDASGTRERRERLADLSDLALESLTRWTVGQIFPGLPSGVVLASLDMTNRARNALSRFGYYTASDLQGLELADLLDLPQVGIGTVDSIIQALADAAASEVIPVLATKLDLESEHDHNKATCQDHLTPQVAPIVHDLRIIARWQATLGTTAVPLLSTDLPPGSPPEVIKARQRLELISAEDVLAGEEAGHDVAAILKRTIGAFESRVQQILARRFFADQPETLDELGRSLGVTRERVRQIEGKARAELVDALEPGGALEPLSSAVRSLIGQVLPLAELITLIPALAQVVETVGQPAWRILDRLDDAYEIEDGWCAAPTILGAQTATFTKLQELANRHGVVRIADFGILNSHQPEAAADHVLREWLRYSGSVIDGDYVLTRAHSVADRAASILSVAGSPMAAQDILDRLGVERSLSSLRNALGSDDRFERVDRYRWALTEWGLESYTGLRALVRDEVAREGGQITLDALIERITGKYSVTASSVVAYASSPPFEAKGGIVRLAAGERDIRKGPERTRRLYRREQSWLYRVKITKEHLRGSGSPAPIAIASIVGIQHGQTRQLATPLGPQAISWTGNQPSFGTIRRFLVDADIETGSEVFLVIGDDGSFGVEPVSQDNHGVVDKALKLIGATDVSARQQPRAALAAAIGLCQDSPAASVIGGYRERGDDDITELLFAARDVLDAPRFSGSAAPTTDIDEILELL